MGSQSESNMLAGAQAPRSSVYKCVESLGYDPNPSDLGGGRLKRLERGVEDRMRF